MTTSLTFKRHANAPRDVVWDAIANLEDVQNWNPGVKRAVYTSTRRSGVGATRHCDLAPRGKVDETVRRWDEGRQIAISIDKGVPVKGALGTFTLTDAGSGGTDIDLRFDYQPKYGPIGWMMNHMMLRRFFGRGLGGALKALAAEAERRTADQPVTRPG